MKWVVISSCSDPELHISASSIAAVICRMVRSPDEPGVSLCWVLYSCKLPALRGLQCRQWRWKRGRGCCHLCSLPGEVQHKAQGSIQILLESVEAF